MRIRLLMALTLCGSLAACVTPPTAYVTHAFPTIQSNQIVAASQPLRLKVVTRRYRGDALYDDTFPWVYAGAVQALNRTGVVQPSVQGEDGKILVTVKELDSTAGDTASGVAKGILAGLTLGAIGNTSTGKFDVSLDIMMNGKTIAHAPVRVDVNIRMGSASVPPGVQSYRDATDALKQALSDAILWTIWDMQQKGLIPLPASS